MKILTIPLTDTYFVTLFNAYSPHATYGISKSGYVVSNKDAIEFSNERVFYNNHTVKRLTTMTEEEAKKIFLEAGIDGIDIPYINYSNREIAATSAMQSFDSFFYEYWDKDLNLTWMITPKPNKKLNGKKIAIEFNVGALDFRHSYVSQDLDVFMTPITRTSKSVSFSVRIPDFLYSKCMTDPIIENRPKRNYLESSTLADLHTQMASNVSQAFNLEDNEINAKKAKKVICINFHSKEDITRDGYNHGYTGQRISTTFNFFVAYKTTGSFGKTQFFTYKKYQTGQGSTERGIKGIIDTELNSGRNYLGNVPSVVISWTQQREDFLIQLEEKFRSLSVNLNSFLSELDEDKLQSLIENAHLLQIGN